MKLNKLWSWAIPAKKETKYLTREDIIKTGFKITVKEKGHIEYFKRGNMSLKWDFHVEHRIVTIKWGKSMRFFGVVETIDELKIIIKNIDKYFGRK